MAEEQNNSDTSDKNWKEMRDKLEIYEGKIAEFEAKERQEVFQKAGLDPSKGVGKAVDMMFEGELSVDNIKQYATEEFGVEFGQQGGLQDTVKSTEESQERLNNIQQNSVVDTFNTDVLSQVADVAQKGTAKQSITAKLYAMEQDKDK